MAEERIPESLYYKPHIWWDPGPPDWFLSTVTKELDPVSLRQISRIRLSLYKDVLTAQVKAVEAAMTVLSQSER